VIRLPALLALSLLAAGCDGCQRAEAPRSSERRDEAAGVRFVEVLTGGADAAETLPLVVVIHGMGGRPESILRRTELAALPVRARVVAPYGLTPLGNGEGFSWFPERSDDASFAEDTRRAADRLDAMIAELCRLRPTAGKPIVTGFSQGGILSFTLAVLHPESLRAAFPVAGLLARPLWPTSWPAGRDQPRIHAFHGTDDRRVPFSEARAVVARLVEVGLSAELTEYPGERHTLSSAERRDLLEAVTKEIRTAAALP
jgi:phospholipase/carboxylesterase